jgi:hypothetical protein
MLATAVKEAGKMSSSLAVVQEKRHSELKRLFSVTSFAGLLLFIPEAPLIIAAVLLTNLLSRMLVAALKLFHYKEATA